MSQEQLRTLLQEQRNSRRPQQIASIEEFVNGRIDSEGVKLPSLEKLSDRDLSYLIAAIDNC